MGETDCGGNWVLFWWVGPCSLNLLSNFLLMGGAVFPPYCLTWDQTMEAIMKIHYLLPPGSWHTQGFFWALWASLTHMGFDSKCDFLTRASPFPLDMGYLFFGGIQHSPGASLVAQWVKSLPAAWESRVRSLVWEDALEKEMATHSSILAWRIPLSEEPGRLQFMGLQESDTT